MLAHPDGEPAGLRGELEAALISLVLLCGRAVLLAVVLDENPPLLVPEVEPPDRPTEHVEDTEVGCGLGQTGMKDRESQMRLAPRGDAGAHITERRSRRTNVAAARLFARRHERLNPCERSPTLSHPRHVNQVIADCHEVVMIQDARELDEEFSRARDRDASGERETSSVIRMPDHTAGARRSSTSPGGDVQETLGDPRQRNPDDLRARRMAEPITVSKQRQHRERGRECSIMGANTVERCEEVRPLESTPSEPVRPRVANEERPAEKRLRQWHARWHPHTLPPTPFS